MTLEKKMIKLVFDIESDGLLDTVSQVWCIVAQDPDTEKVYTFDQHNIQAGLNLLLSADILIGHNIQGYDIPVLKKLYGFDFKGEVWDTLIASRLHHARIQKHSLKAWGQVLVRKKLIEAGKTGFEDWTKYSQDMMDYCIQDVVVNTALFKIAFRAFDFTADYVRLEHEIVRIQVASEEYGVTFDLVEATKLRAKITDEMDSIRGQVENLLGYSWFEKDYRLRKDNTLPVVATRLLTRLDTEFPEFKHKAKMDTANGRGLIQVPEKITLDTKKLLLQKLTELGWKCEWFTEKGSPQLTRQGEAEPNLSAIPGLDGVDLGKYYVLKHRLSIVHGFFKNIRSDDKIPSEANTLGAITGRYTHRKIANLPAVRSLYGSEIRELFGVDKGRVQVGADLAGIEARMLAHYMGDPDYIKEVLDGDIHTANQKAAGLPTRDDAKTFFYGFLYGAGDAKVGQLVFGGAAEGKVIKQQFLESLPTLKELIETKQEEAKAGHITSLDGRPVYITKSKGFNGKEGYDTRKALNTLLQSSATIFFKRWLYFVDLLSSKLDSHLMISYHDEGQWSVAPDDVDAFKEVLYEALRLTDKFYEVRCRNDIDIKTGKNWGDCH